MSAERIAALQARLEKIDAERERRALGAAMIKGSYSGHSYEFAQTTPQDLNDLETRTKLELSRLQGTNRNSRLMRFSY